MGKRVGILLMRHFLEAVRQRRIDVADSEPHWLTSDQYRELEDGRIELFPSSAPELMAHARLQSFRPVGLVVLDDDQGRCRPFIDERVIVGCDREFALLVFHAHAYFWFIHDPSAAEHHGNA